MANDLLKIALGAGLVFVGYEVMQHLHKQETQEARNMKLKIQGIHVENDGTMNIDMLVQNPNSQDFSIKSVIGNLVINKNPVASINMFGNYVVRGNDQETIPLTAKVSGVDVFHALQKYFAAGKVSLFFQGTINVNDKAVPMTLSYAR